MSFAFLPLYTGDYIRDTRHLSMSEHGAFMMLLIYCWDQKGPAPLDERQLVGICNARSKDEVEAMGRILQEFFVKMSDGWYNRRMQREIERSHAIGIARSIAGAKGYQARAKQLPSKCLASASKPPPPSHSSPPPPPKSTTVSGSQANTDAIRLIEFLNQKTGRRFRATPTTLKPILARLKEYTFDECRGVIVRRWVVWKDDLKMREYLRPDTLFNATKFAQYVGDVPTPEEMNDAN